MPRMPATPVVPSAAMTTPHRPAPVDTSTLDDADLDALNDHMNRIRTERDPDFPPRPLSETRVWAREVPGFIDRRCWWVREPTGRVVAFALADAYDVENNRHLLETDFGVDPDRRRQGLGTLLLEAVASHAHETDRRLVLFETDSSVPSGESFARFIGADPGLRVVTSRVATSDLDRALLRSWREHGESAATDFEVAWYDGAYPDEALPQMVELMRVMNDAPTEDLDVGDFEFTAEQVRQDENAFEARGIERWTLVALHRPTGRAAGFTQIYWNPSIPHLGQQGDTGVQPDFRGHRLGRWLKAVMAERLLAERPAVTAIQTSNAGSNEPMLAINRAMGFREHKAHTVWQVAADTILGSERPRQVS